MVRANLRDRQVQTGAWFAAVLVFCGYLQGKGGKGWCLMVRVKGNGARCISMAYRRGA